MKTLEKLILEINTWDTADARHLVSLINNAKHILSQCDSASSLSDFVDFSSLNSAVDIPSKIAEYPVWTVDSNGMALVGESADQLMRYDNVISEINE